MSKFGSAAGNLDFILNFKFVFTKKKNTIFNVRNPELLKNKFRGMHTLPGLPITCVDSIFINSARLHLSVQN